MDGEIDQHKSFMDVFSDTNALDAFLQSQDSDNSLNSAGSLLDMYLNRPPDFTTMQSDRNSKTSFSSLQKNAVKFSNAAFNFPSEINFNSEFSPPRAQPNFIMQQNVNINSFNDDCSPSDIYQSNFDKKDVRSNSNLKNSSLSRRSKDSSKSRGQRPLEISQNVELQKTDSRTNSGSNPAVLNQMIGSQTNINVIVNHTIFEPSTASATPSITTFTDKTSSNPSPFMFINGAQLANQMQQNKPQLFSAGGRILPYNAVQKILESKQQLNQQKVIQQQHPLLQRKQQESLYLQQQQQIQQRLQQQQQPIKIQQQQQQQQQQLFQQYQQQQQRRIQLSQQQMPNTKNAQTSKRVKSQTRRSTPVPAKKMAPANSPHTFVLNNQGLSLLNHMPQANHQSNLPQNNQTYLLNEVLRVTPTSSGNSNQNVLPSHFLVKQPSSSNPILISYPHINSATPLQNVVSGLTQPVVLGNGGQVNSIQQKQPTQIIIPSANVSNLNNIRFLIPQSLSFNNKSIAPKLLQGSQVVNLASAGNSNNLMPVRNLIPVLQQQQRHTANQQQVNAPQQFQNQNNQQLQSQLQQLVQQQQQQQLQHLIQQQQQQQQRDKTSFQQLVQQFQSHASKSVIASLPKTQQPAIKPTQRSSSVANRTKKISNEQPVQVPFFPITLSRVSAAATTTTPSVSVSSSAVYSDAANNAFLMNSSVQQPKVVIIPHQVNSQSVHHPSSDASADESLNQPAPENTNKGTCFQDVSNKTSRSPCADNELSLDEQFKIITANIKSLISMANRSSGEESVAKQLMVKRMEILKQIEPAVIERLKSTNPELFQIDLSFTQLDSNEVGKPNILQDTKPKLDYIKISVDRINSDQLKKLRFVDVPLLQAHGLYEKELSEKHIAELLRLEEHVVRSLPAQQQNFVKNQVEIVKQILEKRVECEQSVQDEIKVDLTKCKKEPDAAVVPEAETPSKEASTEETGMLKKIVRCERFYKRLQQDHHNVLSPDVTRPFSSFRDACDRLLCYHVYSKHEDDADSSNFDAEFSKISEKLLAKIGNLKRRYRKLLLDECIVGIPTKVEKVLVAKLNLEMETENKGLFASKWTEDCYPQKRLKLGGEILPIGCNSHVEALRMSYSMNKYGVKDVDTALRDLCNENDPFAENAYLDMKTMSDRHKTLDLTNSDSHDLSDDEELFNVFNNVLEFDAG